MFVEPSGELGLYQGLLHLLPLPTWYILCLGREINVFLAWGERDKYWDIVLQFDWNVLNEEGEIVIGVCDI